MPPLPSLAALRDALRREARCLCPDIPPLASFLESFLPAASLRRAALTYAIGNAMGVDESRLRPPALAVELAHAATLLHDDLLDGDAVRRRMPALWKAASPHAAVLSGDFLLCRALETLAQSPRADLVPLFARAVSRVCRGEIRQDFETSSTSRAEKTAPLFAFAAAAAAPPDASPALLRALARTGWRLGAAFQACDDATDGDVPRPPLPPSPPQLDLLAPWPAALHAVQAWNGRNWEAQTRILEV